MTAHLHAMEDQHYMKGRSRHLFWVVLAFLLFSAVEQQVFPSLATAMANLVSRDSSGIAAIALPFVLDGTILLGWVILLVMYGIKSQVKLFKTLFFVLAFFQLFDFLSDFQFHNFLLRIMANQYEGFGMTQVFNSIGTLLFILSNLAWIVCGAIVVFHQKTSTILRSAALLLALYHIYISIYAVASPTLLSMVFAQISSGAYSVLTRVINILNDVAALAVMAFFFAALSFGKHRQRKAQAAQSILPV